MSAFLDKALGNKKPIWHEEYKPFFGEQQFSLILTLNLIEFKLFICGKKWVKALFAKGDKTYKRTFTRKNYYKEAERIKTKLCGVNK